MKLAVVLFGFLALAFAAEEPIPIVKHNSEPIPIVKQNSEVNVDGSFQSSFETGNGILVEEQGILKNAGDKDKEAQEIRGSFKYTDPDGTPVEVSYIANEDGFQPDGKHLPVAPTPPPVPPLIARALEWIAAHPEPETKKQL